MYAHACALRAWIRQESGKGQGEREGTWAILEEEAEREQHRAQRAYHFENLVKRRIRRHKVPHLRPSPL